MTSWKPPYLPKNLMISNQSVQTSFEAQGPRLEADGFLLLPGLKAQRAVELGSVPVKYHVVYIYIYIYI